MEKQGKNAWLREEYISRINRVIDYIEDNITEELSLKKLSHVANFSAFHFHRIFRAIVGEPLNQFIQRVRLEKAAMKLIGQSKLTITEIALECGFSSSSSFARAFREHFNVSASEWREQMNVTNSKNGEAESNIGKQKSKMRKDSRSSSAYTEGIKSHEWRRQQMVDKKTLNVDVKEIPSMHVAYVRHIGSYKGEAGLFERLFNKLFTWAGARDLLRFPATKVMTVYHDNPEVTDESKLRTSVCITVPEDTEVDGEVGKMTISGGKYVIGHFELDDTEYEEAWNALYGAWLPESGYKPDDGPPFEMYLNDPKEHPRHKSIVDIYIPVKPL